MKRNRYQQARAEGRIPIGHMIVDFNVRGLPKMLEVADVDFVVIDMEHGAFGLSDVADLIAWFRGTTIAPFVRVPVGTYPFIARVLDAGAAGVMVPNVRSAVEAGHIVDAARYRPLGVRGLTFGSAVNDYEEVSDVRAYQSQMNDRTIVICQIESDEAIGQLPEIAATPGIDILWLGQYDLTDSMGILGEFDHPRFIGALQKLVSTAHEHGKLAAIQGGSVRQLREWIELGFDVLSYNDDMSVYLSAMTSGMRELRQALHH
jgi:2-dehydro-3-deoxyglucarate aldolase/4-hydroxy-2-oxoheptanedioate aldolase